MVRTEPAKEILIAQNDYTLDQTMLREKILPVWLRSISNNIKDCIRTWHIFMICVKQTDWA